jgi:hypothetical protein
MSKLAEPQVGSTNRSEGAGPVIRDIAAATNGAREPRTPGRCQGLAHMGLGVRVTSAFQQGSYSGYYLDFDDRDG